MKKEILILATIFIIFFIYHFISWVYSTRRTVRSDFKISIKPIKWCFLEFKWNYQLIIIIAASVSALTMELFGLSLLIRVLFFFLFLILIPQIIRNNIIRKEQERLFRDIILYCHNMAMLLKQNQNVHSALTTVVNDLNPVLQKDIMILIDGLDKKQEHLEHRLELMARKYPYSIIRNLNSIMIHMHYEDNHINEEILNTFYADTDQLNKDIKANRIKRQSLRLQYILITIGSILSYLFLYSQLKQIFRETFQTETLQILNFIYIICTVLSTVYVDNYFNHHLSKE
ncbi:MAG: hypothetical protein VB012_05760 [Erysipelotrichaceae bacterium]|nr:hypothetical protein [Erysipelotrichaceae bacterium]